MFGFIWNRMLKPLFKGVAKVLSASVRWAVANPIASIAVGTGLIILAGFSERPWLQGTLAFMGSLLISSGVSGAIIDELASGITWLDNFIGGGVGGRYRPPTK